MELRQYQEWAAQTDQYPDDGDERQEAPTKSEIIPLLGLVGEVGSLVVEYKKLLRDGPIHSLYRENLVEELGDILWYVANVATKAGLSLEEIAEANLRKTQDRFIAPKRRVLYDEELPPNQRLPRNFAYQFAHEVINGVRKMVMTDVSDGSRTGAPLTDNAHEDDGYRFHDAMHMSFAACLGWSPVLRKLLRNKTKTAAPLEKRFSHGDTPENRRREDAEDGGRAQVVEEAIVYLADAYYSRHPGAKTLDFHLLRYIKDLTRGIEVSSRTEAEWETALLQGFKVWDELRAHDGGVIEGDLYEGTVRYVPRCDEKKENAS
jgi:NTP pyrophosphatase (non-canonical NTP hydrolase)